MQYYKLGNVLYLKYSDYLKELARVIGVFNEETEESIKEIEQAIDENWEDI